MGSQKQIEFELPGIGEIRAREGTSTVELAGAVKFWHDKYKSARTDGFIGGVAFSTMFAICSFGAYYLLG